MIAPLESLVGDVCRMRTQDVSKTASSASSIPSKGNGYSSNFHLGSALSVLTHIHKTTPHDWMMKKYGVPTK